MENDVQRTPCSLTIDMSSPFVPLGLPWHTATRSITFRVVKTEKSVGKPRGRVPPEKNYDRNRTVLRSVIWRLWFTRLRRKISKTKTATKLNETRSYVNYDYFSRKILGSSSKSGDCSYWFLSGLWITLHRMVI